MISSETVDFRNEKKKWRIELFFNIHFVAVFDRENVKCLKLSKGGIQNTAERKIISN